MIYAACFIKILAMRVGTTFGQNLHGRHIVVFTPCFPEYFVGCHKPSGGAANIPGLMDAAKLIGTILGIGLAALGAIAATVWAAVKYGRKLFH